MALLSSLLWDVDNLLHDSVSSNTGSLTAGTDERVLYNKTIRGTQYRVMSQPAYWQGNSRAFDQITLDNDIVNTTTWSIQILMRIPHPAAQGGIIRFLSNDLHFRIWSNVLDNGTPAEGVAVPENRWFVLTYRQNGTNMEMYYDDVLVLSGMTSQSLVLNSNLYVNAFDADYMADVEIASIQLWDEYITISVPETQDSDWHSEGTLSGSAFIEEEDAGEQSDITVLTDNSIDISFPGVVCWGCLEGPVRTQYDFRGIVNRDTFILGTGHIAPQVQLIAIFQNYSRTDIIARIYVRLDTDYTTILGVRGEVYNDGGSLVYYHDFSAGFLADTDYSFRLGRNGNTYYLMYAGEEVSYVQANTTEDRFMMGLNLGAHYGQVGNLWHIRFSGIIMNQTNAEPLAQERVKYNQVFSGGMFEMNGGIG